ncbi:hypothetical protein [Halolamina salifodinae]|uniref:Kef-type K+ transport system membrane component KefB n=1 Tax=Halolamina salifodinae TaxID=1202767 RepID=A0A8T4H1A7_9EURY|nr:hypothetical protein [Halolamina salifodinae]MBP1988133.1 Kef-type K+ transport system membrane component KefB [Halolamina salifodinae]
MVATDLVLTVGASLTVVDSPAVVQLLAALGVVLLPFLIWLELSLASLIENRPQFARAGAVENAGDATTAGSER